MALEVEHADVEKLWDLSGTVDDVYVPYIRDVARMVTIQQVLYVMTNMSGSANAFRFTDFFSFVLFLAAGISVHWLIVDRLFRV